MKDMRRKEKVTVGILLAVYVSFLVFIYPKLPNDLPMQFSATGEVNWSLPKFYGVLLFSGLWVFVIANYIFAKKDARSLIVVLGILLMVAIGMFTYIVYYC